MGLRGNRKVTLGFVSHREGPRLRGRGARTVARSSLLLSPPRGAPNQVCVMFTQTLCTHTHGKARNLHRFWPWILKLWA